jgi:hypothetical protein
MFGTVSGAGLDLGTGEGGVVAAGWLAHAAQIPRSIAKVERLLIGGLLGTQKRRVLEQGLERFRFAWTGSVQPREAHYFRIYGPVTLIEYDNTQDGANHFHCEKSLSDRKHAEKSTLIVQFTLGSAKTRQLQGKRGHSPSGAADREAIIRQLKNAAPNARNERQRGHCRRHINLSSPRSQHCRAGQQGEAQK